MRAVEYIGIGEQIYKGTVRRDATVRDTETKPKLVFSVDVEDWFDGSLFSSTPDKPENRLHYGMDRILALLDHYAYKGTFFWLGDTAKRHPDILRVCVQAGHEVGLHHMHHSFISRSTATIFKSELIEAKDLVEQITAKQVLGFRAPFFSFSANSLWALDILAEMDFRYDSSIIPFRHYHYGIPGAPHIPHVRQTQYGNIAELPVATVQRMRYRIPAAGGAYSRVYPYAFCKENLLRYSQEGFIPVYYCHPWEFDAQHPRVGMRFPSNLLHYFRLGTSFSMLTKLIADFSCISMLDYLHRLESDGVLTCPDSTR